MVSLRSRFSRSLEAMKHWAIPDASLPLEEQFFRVFCLLGGLLTLCFIIPLNTLQGLSPWVNRELFGFSLLFLAIAWAARRGRAFKKTMLLLMVLCLDLIWFPNGGSQGSIGLYFFAVALFIVLFFNGPFRLVALALLVVNASGLHIAELAWPHLATPFKNPTERLLDVCTDYGVSLLVCAFMLWVILAGFQRNTKRLNETLEALQASEDRFKSVFQFMPVALAITSLEEGRFLAINQAMEAAYGYSAEEMGRVTSIDAGIWTSDEVRREVVARLKSGQPLKDFQTKIRHRDGSLRWISLSAEIVDLAATPFILSGVVDITERKNAEEERAKLQAQLHQAQKMESIGSLAGGVAHDMNNVLGAILALASVHRQKAAAGSALHKDMDTITSACQRGGKLVKGLLAFAHQTLAEEREVNLNAVVQEEVDLLARTTLQKVHLHMELAEGLHLVLGDPAALSHALMNLCVNAVDAMGEGGTLTLRTHNEGEDSVLLEVADSGCGMPKEVLDQALNPFFTTKPQGKGTGLGLPMVYSTVKAHRGELEIQSEPGQGTRIRLHLPAYRSSAADLQAEEVPSFSPLEAALQVLLVDDDELIQDAVRAILEALGHTVTTVSGGEEAVAALEAGLHPDVVVLDMNMPGLDGAGTLPRLRVLRPSLPVLLATGRVDQAALNLVEADAWTTLLPKPFSLEALRQSLEACRRG